MSNHSPLEEKVGAPTGSEENWDTRSAPMPVAVAVVPLLLAVAVPDCVVEEPVVELTAPVGAGGGEGAVVGGTVGGQVP